MGVEKDSLRHKSLEDIDSAGREWGRTISGKFVTDRITIVENNAYLPQPSGGESKLVKPFVKFRVGVPTLLLGMVSANPSIVIACTYFNDRYFPAVIGVRRV